MKKIKGTTEVSGAFLRSVVLSAFFRRLKSLFDKKIILFSLIQNVFFCFVALVHFIFVSPISPEYELVLKHITDHKHSVKHLMDSFSIKSNLMYVWISINLPAEFHWRFQWDLSVYDPFWIRLRFTGIVFTAPVSCTHMRLMTCEPCSSTGCKNLASNRLAKRKMKAHRRPYPRHDPWIPRTHDPWPTAPDLQIVVLTNLFHH